MKKTELIAALAKKQRQLNKKDVELAVDCILGERKDSFVNE